MRKAKAVLSFLGMSVLCFGSVGFAAEFPTGDLSGIIMWGAGGPTDNVSRVVTPLVEPHLKQKIVLQNKSGASGAMSMQFVLARPHDGYTLLYGAENPLSHKVMGVAPADYDQFYPISIVATDIAVAVVNADAKWNTIQDLFNDAKKNPGKIRVATTGSIDMQNVISAMIKAEDGIEFNKIPFNGGGEVVTALLGKHADVSFLGLGVIREHLRANRLKALVVFGDKPIPGMETTPIIVATHSSYKKYLPWGTFYGVWVPRDVPDAQKKLLVDAFKKGTDDPKFQAFLKNFGPIYMGIHGEEADRFLKHWQSVTNWLLYDVGMVKTSPEKFGIAKP